MVQKIGLIYNTVPEPVRTGVFSECASENTVKAVEQALIQGGNEILSVNLHSPGQIKTLFREQGRPEFAFVIAEGFLEQPETLLDGSGAALVRRMLSEMGIAASHSSIAAMELCRQKELTYQALARHNVPCPWHVYLPPGLASAAVPQLAPGRYPLFVKPAGGGNSVGIDENSVVSDAGQLAECLAGIRERLGPVAVVLETFLPGPEYTVAVIGNNDPVVLPPVAFPANLVRTGAVKKMEAKDEVPVHIIDPREPLYFQLRDLALNTFAALGCADVIRIDVKTDNQGTLHVIDVNGTPSLGPNSSLARMAGAIELEYAELINLILAQGLQRIGQTEYCSELVLAAEEKLHALRNREQVA